GAGNAQNEAAPTVVEAAAAQKGGQAITVTQAAPATAVFNTSFPVAATASSGLPVAIGASGACSISGGTVTMTSGTGICTVTFDQTGNANYAAAPQLVQTTAVQAVGPAPTISSFTPTAGAVGASVSITGANFTGATAVAFNGASAGFTVNAATKITATVPMGATTGKIGVTTPTGTATSATTVTAAPRISSLRPTGGVVGTSVTITGANLTGTTAVTFNGTSASFTVNTATKITATVPAGATSGPISVTTAGGTAVSGG